MDKTEVDKLTDAEVYAQALDVARSLGGDESVRRLTSLPTDQIRNFLIRNG
jgi:hypothetical protein